MSLERIVLGTAQLGLAYGRRRNEKVLNEHEAYVLLEAAWSRGIRAFDTAEAYGPAADRLARWLRGQGVLGQAAIVTKIAATAITDRSEIEKACARFAGSRSVTILSHGSAASEDFQAFREVARSVGAESGQSVYTDVEVRAAAAAGASLVQAPANVFDLRQLEAAHAARVHLDARSIFLQGILLESSDHAESRVPGISDFTRVTTTAAARSGLPAAAALLAGVMAQLRPGDRAVVGIDSPAELDDIGSAESVPMDQLEHFLELIAEARQALTAKLALLDPRTWNGT